MKRYTNYFLMTALCLVMSISSYGQENEEYVSHPDTLRIDMDNGQAVELTFMDIENATFNDEFISQWKAAIDKIQAIVSLKKYDELVRVQLKQNVIENEKKDVVEVERIEDETDVYITSNGQLKDITAFNIVKFDIENVRVRASLTSMEALNELKAIDLAQLHDKLKAEQHNIGTKRKAYYLNTQTNNTGFTDLKITDRGVRDFLTLTGGIGAGIIRDKLAPEFSFNLSISLKNKHGVDYQKFGVQSSFHYLFDKDLNGDYDMNVNTFVTGFYKHNFSKSSLKDNWAGVGIGYLVKESGGYFKGDTFKASLLLNAHQSAIDIIPEIIFTNDFKTVFPSLRFGLTF